MSKSADARQDALLVAYLQTFEPVRLARVLTGLGVEPEKVDLVTQKADPRTCTSCGYGFVRCRALDAKAPEDDKHPWAPDKTRSGLPIQRTPEEPC